MATTRFVLTPESAAMPSSNFAPLTKVNGRPVLAFDAATDESAVWTIIAPQGLSGALSVKLTYMMAAATTGSVVFTAEVEAVADGDAVDLDTTSSFDSANSGSDAVPGTAGYPAQFTISLTNADSIAAGDLVRIRITRDADNASDTATGDAYLRAAEVIEA